MMKRLVFSGRCFGGVRVEQLKSGAAPDTF
jgi:hypothetical protein